MKKLKPFDVRDLRNIISSSDAQVEALEDDLWSKDFTEAELLQIILRGTEGLRIQLSRATNISAVLFALSEDGSVSVRQSVASGALTPPSVLEELARDCNQGIRAAVASNALTAPEILEVLAGEKNSAVRVSVACNESTATDTLWSLILAASDEDKLQSLSKEQVDAVCDAASLAVENVSLAPERLSQLAESADGTYLDLVIRNPSTPNVVRRKCSSHPDAFIRSAVAASEFTPVDVLGTLAKDADRSVRMEIALNRMAPIGALRLLAKSPDQLLKQRAQKALVDRGQSIKPDKRCFIATAAMGSMDDQNVETLREFRDRMLLRNNTGRVIVELYYILSPRMADYVRCNAPAKFIIKWIIIMPCVFWIRKLSLTKKPIRQTTKPTGQADAISP